MTSQSIYDIAMSIPEELTIEGKLFKINLEQQMSIEDPYRQDAILTLHSQEPPIHRKTVINSFDLETGNVRIETYLEASISAIRDELTTVKFEL